MQTAQLVYSKESGALDESYSDIFAILVANWHQPNIGLWQWEIGRGFGTEGHDAIRDLSDPTKYGHPDHMESYHDLLDSMDWGGVHKNSGIHNKAAYNLLTSKDDSKRYLFTPKSMAQLFYLALNRLSETSGFSDSRRAIEKAAKTLFRGDSSKEEKLTAIASAFDSVGITLS